MRKFLQKIKEIKTGTLQYTRNKYDSRRLIHGLKWTRGKKIQICSNDYYAYQK